MLGKFPRFIYGLLLLGVIALSAFRGFSADDSLARRIARSLLQFYADTLPEKVYLHLDRAYYTPGQTIWLKAYVVEADTHRPDTLSQVLYVDLVSPRRQVVARRVLRLAKGVAPADIALPDTLLGGTYQLRAYTSWMRNAGSEFLYTRSLPLLAPTAATTGSPTAHPDVQFFPEGGTLLTGVTGTVGFKAVGADGRGVDVQGQVVDDQNQTVGRFTSLYRGMGSFSFSPVAGRRYYAVVQSLQGSSLRYPLPEATSTGYSLHLNENPEELVVTLTRRGPASETPDGPVLLLAHVREQIAYAAQIQLTSAAPVVARLPKAKFNAGLAHLTLFDTQGNALCERLAFIPPANQARLTISLNKPTYGPREAVEATLRATDENGQPVAGNFSLAVTLADEGASPASLAGTITSHLLLTSDLAGTVETPGYYLQQPQTAAVQQALNNLLLTQGWRRFVWRSLLAGSAPAPVFPLEKELVLSGQLLNNMGKPLAQQSVFYLQSSPAREAQATTDANGRFLFRGLDGADTAMVLLRAQLPKQEPVGRLSIDSAPALPTSWAAVTPTLSVPAFVPLVRRQVQQEQQFLATQKAIALRNVTVKGRQAASNEPTDGITRTYHHPGAVYLPVGHLAATAGTQTVLQYLRGRVAGVSATEGEGVNMRNAMTILGKKILALYVLDGVIISDEQFQALRLADIETIDILKQDAAGLFGTQAAGGVIVLHSRTRGLDLPTPSHQPKGNSPVASVVIPAYYQAREFYAPRYPLATPPQPDPRYVTIYWAPLIHTQANGTAQVTFYTSDANGSFDVVAEGLAAAHLPLHGTTNLRVHEKN